MFDFTDPIAQNCRSDVCAAEALGQPGDLDRIAQRGAGAMRFDIADVAGRRGPPRAPGR